MKYNYSQAQQVINRNLKTEEFHEMLQLEYFTLIPLDELETDDENTW